MCDLLIAGPLAADVARGINQETSDCACWVSWLTVLAFYRTGSEELDEFCDHPLTRVRSDFDAMPSLELTLGQAVRLWNLAQMMASWCSTPRWTRASSDGTGKSGHLAPSDRDIRRSETGASHISVRRSKQPDTHV